jgi:ABC-type Fe3+-hydroxamate transport system substrate-binding protein
MTEDAQAVEVNEDELPPKGTTEWYEAMSKVMRAREHAKAMIARWQDKLNDAEADIKELMGETTEPDA